MHWQPMTTDDLPAVNAVADRVHASYPEDNAVFAERLGLYPEGCFALNGDAGMAGYIISHPWLFKKPPQLKTLLEKIPSPATTYYIHDIALLPGARHSGAASAILEIVRDHAKARRFRNMSLVAVNNSVHFWERHGFRTVIDPELDPKLKSYDADARFMVCDLSS
jgi:ribosomal protein S18 acetylase RimI-like enzyme